MKKRLLHRLCFDRWLLLYLDITEDQAQKDHQSKNGWWSCLLMMYRRQLLDFVSDFFAFQREHHV